MRVLVETIKTHKLVPIYILLSVVGMSLVWLHQSNYGVGLSPDAIFFLSVAESLSDGYGFRTLQGGNFSHPPLSSIGVGAFTALGIGDVFVAARYMNIIIFGLIILVSLIWISDKVDSKFWLIWAGTTCALSPALIHVSLYARTDSMFILFSVLSLWKLDQWTVNSKDSNLILAATYASLSSLTRYTGFAVLLSSLIIIGFRRHIMLREKVRYAIVYAVVSALPSGIWMLRNYFTIGRLTAPYGGESSDWFNVLEAASQELTKMMLGVAGFDYLAEISERFGISRLSIRVIFLVASIVIFFGVHIYCQKKPVKPRGVAIPLVFVMVYALFLSAALSLETTSFLSRYLAPMHVPLLIIMAIIFGHIFRYNPPSVTVSSQASTLKSLVRTQRYIVDGVVRLVAIWYIILLIPPTFDSIKYWREYGTRYSTKFASESETINYIKSNPLSGIVYSNIASHVYTHMDVPGDDRVSIRQLRRQFSDNNQYTWDDNDYVWGDRSQATDFDRSIVWFHFKYSAYDPPYDFVQIAHLSGLNISLVLEDGIVLADEGLSPLSALDAVLGDARLVASSEFNLYLDDRRLIYIAESCRDFDPEFPFFLHIVPADPDDLPDHRKALGTRFDNYDFSFHQEGFRFGERCAVIRNLPAYDIMQISTGQYAEEDQLWREEIYIPT